MLAHSEIDRVVAFLEERFGLDALFVFGSEAAGTQHRGSDLDLGALLRRRPDALELLDAQTALEAIAERDVDLIDLAAASPILARQVLRGGRCMFGAEAPAFAHFEAVLPSRCEDLKRARAEAESALVQRVVHVDRDLVLAKVETLERCLARIKATHERAGLDVLDRQDIIVLNLQRAVQAMLDLAAHVVAREGLGVPDDLAASFEILRHAGVLDEELADHMRRMTGFRNVAVHEYRKLDPKIIDTIVRERLGDLRAFAKAILERFRI